MKKSAMLCVIILVSGVINAQSIERSTLAAAGDTYIKPGIQLSWTLGQPTLVETFSRPSLLLTQGFHQADIQTGIPDDPTGLFSVSLYPNPASSAFTVEMTAGSEGTVRFGLFDISGKLILQEGPFLTTDGRWVHNKYIHGLAPGLYHIRFVFIQYNGNEIRQNVKLTIL